MLSWCVLAALAGDCSKCVMGMGGVPPSIVAPMLLSVCAPTTRQGPALPLGRTLLPSEMEAGRGRETVLPPVGTPLPHISPDPWPFGVIQSAFVVV